MTMISLRKLGTAATVALGLGFTVLAAGAGEAAAASPCQVIDADVEGGTAMFTVGPADCSGQVGPISFSTYLLPSGEIQPYADQVLIAHSDQNGRFYGAGTYTLTASIGDALNWQADLYMADSIGQAPQPNPLAADAQTGMTSSTPTTVASSPSVAGLSGSRVESFTPPPQQQDVGGTLPLTGSAPARVLVIAAGVTLAGFAIKRLSRMPQMS
jgi:hypothetical protein